jgi:hypothetical protein
MALLGQAGAGAVGPVGGLTHKASAGTGWNFKPDLAMSLMLK